MSPALPQRADDDADQAGPQQETAVANVDRLQRIVAEHRPVRQDETCAGTQQPQQEQVEQRRLGAFTAAPGHPPAHDTGHGQGREQ